ncbi:MAG: pyridoxamine 5'-phosphate oxidase [Coraliomargarita sp.]
MDLSELRQSYTKHSFSKADLLECPFEQFKKWFAEAQDVEIEEPNAMCLASASADGQPSTRIVLLKGISAGGFVFYTNYESRKAAELDANPHAAANFLWLPLQRQVNVRGRVERVSKAESLKYFLSRPFGSQLGAWTSPQSQVITSRQILEAKLEQMKRKFTEGKIPLPDNWGGYRLIPETFEFWQGRPNRLHDRLCFSRDGAGAWIAERLAP